jgi:uncharacterized protein (DUF4415 family)
MSAEDIRNKAWTEAELTAFAESAARQAAADSAEHQTGDSDSGIDYTDIPRLTDLQLSQMVRLRDLRQPKVPVSVRLDAKVLDWLKSKGSGHLTRINDILLNLMEAEASAKPSR